jgi:DNA-binding NtrC family response regulator
MIGRRKSCSGDQTVILIADDEVLIRSVARIALEKEGYYTLACHDGEEALHISRSFPGTIHAVLSDVKMPKVNGLELREQILAERPGIKVLLMSGQTDSTVPSSVEFLPKPFGPAVLQDRMRQLLASPASV